MSTKCPKCRTENTEDSQFCKKCATPLEFDVVHTKTLETPTEELTTGSTFAGRYQIIEELGKGGMGSVYKVLDKETKEKIALKLIKPEIASDKKTIERFRNELTTARKIVQKNVCRMYDLNKEKDKYYITMEFVSGGDLKKLIRRTKLLPVGTAISIAKQICEGLEEAHSLGIVHRDIKPNNIMIDDNGNARIMDFGIARTVKEKGITGAGVMIGTPEYMSPEQVEAKDVDQRSDLYSLGIILYEMLTGRLPFEAETPFAVGVKHKSGIPKSPQEYNSQISDDLNRVILRCLEKGKEDRYQDAGEVRSELEKVEQGLPTTDRVAPRKKTITSREITVKFSMRKVFVPASIILACMVVGLMIWSPWKQKEPTPISSEIPSIAVLPFVDLSPQKDQRALCDGIPESIIMALSRVENIHAPASTSSFSFRGNEGDLKNIGEKLKVKTLLTGSLQISENTVRIRSQLINIADNSVIWNEQYDRELEDIFVIQDEITLKVIEMLKVKLLGEEKEAIVKRHTENIEAYNLYLRGLRFTYEHTEPGYRKSIEYFEKAINLDRTYALAYVGFANCYMQLCRVFNFPHDEGYPKVKEALRKALELDETLGEAHALLGFIKFISEWDIPGPDFDFLRAIELSPGSAYVYTLYTMYLGWIGRHEKSIVIAERALELDPLAFQNYQYLGWAYFYANRYDESIRQLIKILDLDPNFFWAHVYLAHNYTMKGMYAEAIVHADKVESMSLAADDFSLLSNAVWSYAKSGRQDKAKEILEKLEGLPEEKSLDPMAMTTIYAGLGQKDKAFECLTEGYKTRSGQMVYLKIYGRTFLKDLSSDPRYIELLKKMGFE